MDTISLNIGIIGNNSFNLENLVKGVNNIHSPYGYTYCDFIKLNSNYEFNIKVSYPRFFKGINAFLLENPLLCKQVNLHLVNSLKEILSIFNYTLRDISLIRVDIPFTYYMKDNLDFDKYFNVFRILSHVYYNTRISTTISPNVKGIIDMLSTNIETVTFTSARGSGGNKEITIYNQYLNIERKTSSPSQFEEYMDLYPNLKKRIRIEVSKRINRGNFSPDGFAYFDILGTYGEQCKDFLLKYLFNKKQLEIVYNLFYQDLDNSFKRYIFTYGRINYINWLHMNKELLIDYDVIRAVLVNNIPNYKTLESAITTVRKELSNLTLLNVFFVIEDIKKTITDYKFSVDNNEVIESVQVIKE
ncbi:hypothetical protein [Fusobacterium canifelinum]|uniref:Uncharacterized protein n=1 Tax=Fusobacterium canifelinum TaxID=285729 RepID=A0A3P1V344_9FUSO|nr:hypothetical protein [Fusobacterium canifelinum]RRD28511.1 hypothetical protein EII27_02520 [Fusobacterium canifelinum]